MLGVHQLASRTLWDGHQFQPRNNLLNKRVSTYDCTKYKEKKTSARNIGTTPLRNFSENSILPWTMRRHGSSKRFVFFSVLIAYNTTNSPRGSTPVLLTTMLLKVFLPSCSYASCIVSFIQSRYQIYLTGECHRDNIYIDMMNRARRKQTNNPKKATKENQGAPDTMRAQISPPGFWWRGTIKLSPHRRSMTNRSCTHSASSR